MKHTPGEWNCDMMPGYIFSTIDGDEVLIAKLSDVGPLDELTANARLITAAPELLEACKLAVAEAEMYLGSEDFSAADAEVMFRNVFNTARAAIAKTEGA